MFSLFCLCTHSLSVNLSAVCTGACVNRGLKGTDTFTMRRNALKIKPLTQIITENNILKLKQPRVVLFNHFVRAFSQRQREMMARTCLSCFAGLHITITSEYHRIGVSTAFIDALKRKSLSIGSHLDSSTLLYFMCGYV